MSSVSPISGNLSVSQFITLLSVGGAGSSAVQSALTVDGNINLSILSALGGLSNTNTATASLSILQLFLGSVAGYELLYTQVQQTAQKIQDDQAAIAADQAIINDPKSTKDQITAAQSDLTAKQADLATQEATLFYLGVIASSVHTESMVNRIGYTTLPASALSQLLGANNQTITLPKDPSDLLREFVSELQLTSSFSDPSKLAALTSSYLSVFEKLVADIVLLSSAQSALDKLDSSSPDYAAQVSQANSQIASLQQSVISLQSELFALSVQFILPSSETQDTATVSQDSVTVTHPPVTSTPPPATPAPTPANPTTPLATSTNSPATPAAPQDTQTPLPVAPASTPYTTAVDSVAQPVETETGFLGEIQAVSATLNSDLSRIQAAQAAVVELDPSADDYSAQVAQYSKQIAALSNDLSIQQGRLLGLAIRVQSADITSQNPDLAASREELLSELKLLASGATIRSNDLRPTSV